MMMLPATTNANHPKDQEGGATRNTFQIQWTST
jgi:hypothetical protein